MNRNNSNPLLNEDNDTDIDVFNKKLANINSENFNNTKDKNSMRAQQQQQQIVQFQQALQEILHRLDKLEGEMHGPTAVGKMVSFKPETYYDPMTKQFYSGVYVDAYISKGAQDTWEKILDGTLQGFSIGGKIVEAENEVNKSTGKPVRFIKEYSLIELSVVDSPANELCNILSIQKMNGQLIFKGIAAETVTENIFYCEDSDSVQMIHSSAELLHAVVDDVLDYSKLESGVFEVDIQR